MNSSDDATDLQKLATVRAITGDYQLRLRPHERLIKAFLGDDTVSVLIETYRVRELTRESRLEARGQKLIGYKREGGTWLCQGQLISWDDDFEPVVIAHFGKGYTPAEYRARRLWEGDCHRPGTDAQPMDSAARAAEGYSPMQNYWMKG